eukprot:3092734-Prymnesium_polylepis.1
MCAAASIGALSLSGGARVGVVSRVVTALGAGIASAALTGACCAAAVCAFGAAVVGGGAIGMTVEETLLHFSPLSPAVQGCDAHGATVPTHAKACRQM